MIEVLTNNELKIRASIPNTTFDFKEFQIKDNFLYLSVENATNTGVITFDISDKVAPKIIKTQLILGDKANNLDLAYSSLILSSSNPGNVSKLLLFAPSNPSIFSMPMDSNYALHSLDYDFNQQGLFYSRADIPLSNESQSLNGNIMAHRKNSLLYYLDFSNSLFSTLDYSGLLASTPFVTTLEQSNLPGTFNGMTNNEQKFYLTNSSNLIYLLDSEIPHTPEAPISINLNQPTSHFHNNWSHSRHKYLFLEDDNALLRVFTKANINQDNAEIKFYAKGVSVSGEASKVLVRVNNEDFQTIDLTDNFTSYTINYSRNLTANDTVRLILLNPTSTFGEIPAVISSLKVLNKYCYQQMTETHDDIGLVDVSLQYVRPGLRMEVELRLGTERATELVP